MTLSPAERRLRGWLRALAIVLPGLAVALQVVGLVGPPTLTLRPLPLAATGIAGAVTLGLSSLYAAGDVRRGRGLAHLVAFALATFAVSAGSLLWLADAPAAGVPASGAAVSVLPGWIAAGASAVAAALLWAFLHEAARTPATPGSATPGLAARSDDDGEKPPRPALAARDAADRPKRAERRLRTATLLLGGLYGALALAHAAGPFLPPSEGLFGEPSTVALSLTAFATAAALCIHAGTALRVRQSYLGLVVAGHSAAALSVLLFLLGGTARDVALPMGTGTVDGATLLVFILGGTVLPAAALFWLYQRAWRARYELRFLGPIEFRTLMALADVLVMGMEEAISPERAARNVEQAVRDIRARRRWVYRAVLFAVHFHPLLYLRAPLSQLEAGERERHIKKHFYRAASFGLVPEWWRTLAQAAIRIGKQLTYVGYYSDPLTYDSVGYVRFSDRPAADPPPERVTVDLDVRLPPAIDDPRLTADICIIGSGAAGAVLAHRLAERHAGRGLKILVAERGRHVDPSTFSEDEVEMMGKLYADGLFQQTTDFRFTILQGSCVGGTTVVNNAVSFDPPDDVVASWNARHDAAIDVGALAESTAAVRELIEVTPQDHDRLNPSAPRFVEAARRYASDGAGGDGTTSPPRSLRVDVVEANIRDCLGCGYCNIGCAYGRKLSMLDRVLPLAQGSFPGVEVEIVAECEVRNLRTVSGRPLRVLDAEAVLSDGRRVTIEADTFVVSAGVIASSYLLLRSGLGSDLPVGHGASFNMGSPVTAEFGEPMDAYRGLQISHYGVPATDRGFVVETWWNPPVAQAVNMPGWFEDHYRNMRDYRRLMAVGVLVGTESTARIRRALTGGPDVSYSPSPGDLRKLGDGLALTAEILFEAGARRLMLNTWGYDVLTHPNQIPDIYRIVSDPSYITLGTGHPQGGNALSRDPARGVVGPDFRVHGYENLYVCDASVFPTSLTVNPQLTVMALAHYAGSRMEV